MHCQIRRSKRIIREEDDSDRQVPKVHIREENRMDACQTNGSVSAWGRVSVKKLANLPLTSKHNPGTAISVRRSRYTWKPPREIADQLPQGFSLALNCLIDSDGVRRFVPILPVQAFIL